MYYCRYSRIPFFSGGRRAEVVVSCVWYSVLRLSLQISVLRETFEPFIVHCWSFLYARRHEPLFRSLVYCILATANQGLRMGLEQN